MWCTEILNEGSVLLKKKLEIIYLELVQYNYYKCPKNNRITALVKKYNSLFKAY